MIKRTGDALHIWKIVDNLYELYDGVNPAVRQITRDLTFNPGDSVEKMGNHVREFLSVTLDEQRSFGNTENSFKEWRKKLEELGLFIFKDAFQEDDFSGFCLYDDTFPIIYVNNTKPFSRQIFTLFHELAHLLFKTGGVDTNVESYIDYLDGENQKIEIICNSFAGEFFVPTAVFNREIKGVEVDEASIISFANSFHVSREVILRKFLDQGKIDQEFYSKMVFSWKKSSHDTKSSGGGNYYFTKGAYLGSKYIEKAFAQYHQNRITTERLADYLGVKVKNIVGMESLLYKSGSST